MIHETLNLALMKTHKHFRKSIQQLEGHTDVICWRMRLTITCHNSSIVSIREIMKVPFRLNMLRKNVLATLNCLNKFNFDSKSIVFLPKYVFTTTDSYNLFK